MTQTFTASSYPISVVKSDVMGHVTNIVVGLGETQEIEMVPGDTLTICLLELAD